jgi:hypothetical protein
MEVQRYIFQSPSSSQVQIGRPDPSVKQEDTSTKSSQEQLNIPSQTATQVQSTSEVKPTIQASSLLDIYA